MLSAASLAVLALTSGAFAADDVANSKHNLSTSGNTNDIYVTTGTSEICVFCHTPHHGDAGGIGVALWNRGSTAASFTMYSSSTIDMTIAAQPGGISLACLSCHDGTVAFDNLYNGPGAGDYNGNAWDRGYTWNGGDNVMPSTSVAYIGTDLSDDHPVSITYDETVDTAFVPIGTVITDGIPLYGSSSNQVECGSCHNPHDATFAPFLRMDNAGSALCLTCHIK